MLRSYVKVTEPLCKCQVMIIFPLSHFIQLYIFPRVFVDCTIRQPVGVVTTVHEGAFTLAFVEQSAWNLFKNFFVLLDQ